MPLWDRAGAARPMVSGGRRFGGPPGRTASGAAAFRIAGTPSVRPCGLRLPERPAVPSPGRRRTLRPIVWRVRNPWWR